MRPKPATFSAEKAGGKLALGMQAGLYQAYVDGLPDGWYDLTVAPKRHPKTTAQLGYWWAVVIPAAVEALEEATGGDFGEIRVGGFRVSLAVTPDRAHEFLKALHAANIGSDKPLSLARMTDDQASAMIDFAVKWIVTNLGTVVPEPLETR